MIPYGRQSIDGAAIEEVAEVLKSDFLTQGPAVPRFEQALAANTGAAHGVDVCNATAALHVDCLALDLGPGDILLTPAAPGRSPLPAPTAAPPTKRASRRGSTRRLPWGDTTGMLSSPGRIDQTGEQTP